MEVKEKQKVKVTYGTAEPTEVDDIECGILVEDWTEEKIKKAKKRSERYKLLYGMLLAMVLFTPFVTVGRALGLSWNAYCVLRPTIIYFSRGIVHIFTHTGLAMRVPFTNRTLTIVPQIWPNDSVTSEIVAGTDSWPCQREITLAWVRRLRRGERPYGPDEKATWVWHAMAMGSCMLLAKWFLDWLDGRFDSDAFGRRMAGVE
ncbi:hypothetical protein BST61_g7624 [Cercospora zeina]